MSSPFPRVRRGQRGYSVSEVDEFLVEARRAYTAPVDTDLGRTAPELGAREIRQVAFSMQRGGYATDVVDGALERLEDAFAIRERTSGRSLPTPAWVAEKRDVAQEIVDRLSRPAGERFRRVSLLGRGYDRREVDDLADRVLAYLTRGAPLDVRTVRRAAFRPRRGGYDEAQVDVLLDEVIEILLTLD